MHESPKNVSRKVIPRWRRAKNTPSLELGGAPNLNLVPADVTNEFSNLVEKWKTKKDLNTASEIVFLSSLGQSNKETEEAAQFILEESLAANSLKKLAQDLFKTKNPRDEENAPKPAFRDDPRIFRGEIRDSRRALASYPRNPIAHVELARIYASIGQNKKAEEHFRIAIQLAPTNRFVLRSAARFEVHRGDLERATHILSKNNSHDPWIAAAQISVADLANKEVRNWGAAKRLIDSATDSAQVAELAAAMGTVELKNDRIPRAKKLLQLAARTPNDNVVAQLQWASRNFGFKFDPSLLNRRYTFEAATSHAWTNEKWEEAADSCVRWIADEPFSLRPAMVGGYLASTMLQNYTLAQSFLKQGLLANPHDSGLLNNLAYAQIMEENFEEASQALERAKQLGDRYQKEIIIPATEGLMNYRQGNPRAGSELYLQAVSKADELKRADLAHLAFINFCREEIKTGNPPPILSLDKIQEIYTHDTTPKAARIAFKTILKPILDASSSVKALASASPYEQFSNLLDRLPQLK